MRSYNCYENILKIAIILYILIGSTITLSAEDTSKNANPLISTYNFWDWGIGFRLNGEISFSKKKIVTDVHSLSLKFNPKLIKNFYAEAEVGLGLKDYDFSIFSIGANILYKIPLYKGFGIEFLAGAGFAKPLLPDLAPTRFAKGGLFFSFDISYATSLDLGGTYILYFSNQDFMHSLRLGIGVTYRFGDDPNIFKPNQLERDIQFKPVFAALYKYYNKHPIGTLKVVNRSMNKISKLRAEVFVRRLMDFSRSTKIFTNVEPGQTLYINLYALFNNTVLKVTEDTPITAQVKIIATIDNKDIEINESSTIFLHNRNAMTWTDTRKLVSFVTHRDTPIMRFVRFVQNQYKAKLNIFPSQDLNTAILLYNALAVYGINYSADPKTPFKEYINQANQVDYIQFPREVLRYGSGDCDDLVALYASLCENISIETALITVPRHIFLMVNTQIPASDYKKITKHKRLLVFYNDEVWIPIELTMLRNSFSTAWETAAWQFQKWKNSNKLEITTIQKAWEVYEPVTLEETFWEPSFRDLSKKLVPFQKKDHRLIKTLMRNGLTTDSDKIRNRIKKNPNNPALYNKLGLQYIINKKYTKAIRAFQKSISLNPNSHKGYNNLGNTYLLLKKYKKAIKQYKVAIKKNSNKSSIYLNLARAYLEMGDFKNAKKYYKKAISIQPALRGKLPIKID